VAVSKSGEACYYIHCIFKLPLAADGLIRSH